MPQAGLVGEPATPAEIWQETITLLEQAPAAYIETFPFSEAPAGLIRGYDSKWVFHNYDPNANSWDHVCVQGAVPEFGFPKDLLRAIKHVNHPEGSLTKKEMTAGLLGIKAARFCGIRLAFPEQELLDAVRQEIPQHIRRLTVLARKGVKGQDLDSLGTLPCSNEVVRLQHPTEESGFIYGNSGQKHFQKLLAVNGVISALIPNFDKSSMAYRNLRIKQK